MPRHAARTVVFRYLAAILCAALVSALRWYVNPLLGADHNYLLVYPAVLLMTMYGGAGAGLLCAVLSLGAALYLFDPPVFVLKTHDIPGFLGVTFVTLLILIAAYLQRNAQRVARGLQMQSQEHASSLEREVGIRRRAEEALRESEERFRLLVESATEYAILTCDLAGHITSWNVGAERLLGFSEEEILGSSTAVIFTPEDRRQNRPEEEMRIALEQGSATDERLHLRKNGERFWGSGKLMPLRGPTGEVRGFVKILIDRSDRRRAEEALRESQERYRLLTEANPDAVIVSLDDRIILANAAAQRLLNAPTAEYLLGRSTFEFIHPERHAEVKQRLKTMHTQGQPSDPMDQRMMRADGSEFEAEAVAAPIPWKGRTAIQLILHDITDRKRHEQSLQRASDIHRLLLRELDHRVRNNLASLITLIEISSSGKNNVKEVTTAIRSRAQAMASVHQLLSKQHWTTVNLPNLIHALQPPSAPGTLHVTGPDVAIAARQVTAMGMVLQELFSNSARYGSLSSQGGEVLVQWNLLESDKDSERLLEIIWQERGGPELNVQEPQPGVGLGLIRGLVKSELRGQVSLSFPREGAMHRFSLRLDPLPQLAQMVA